MITVITDNGDSSFFLAALAPQIRLGPKLAKRGQEKVAYELYGKKQQKTEQAAATLKGISEIAAQKEKSRAEAESIKQKQMSTGIIVGGILLVTIVVVLIVLNRKIKNVS